MKTLRTAHRGREYGTVWGVMRYVRLFRPHPALARHLPHPGEGFFGGAGLYVVPLSNGDPACWRPAWGGVRCAAMVGGCA